ncbi:Receptor-interacting serine/threonine-protein kinase 4 [Pseudocyphellaria aurata]|nr:Receptor-interacting serine/threonine-protein kinase 4 [Pseudocyphellaria aurata]
MPIDTEIHILELLLQAAVLTKRYRGPLFINIDSLPQFLDETKWIYYIAWYDHLFDHGYYWEAHRIFRWLLEVLPLSNAKSLLQSKLEAVRQMNSQGEALQIAISASLQVFMQHLEGVESPDDSEWNDFVTQVTFGHFPEHEREKFLVESDNAVLEQLQDNLQCPLPLTHNQRNDTETHRPFAGKTLNLEQCRKDLTEASDSSRYDMHAIFRSAVKEGHVPLVRLLSKQKEVLNCKDSFKQRPLHLAAAIGHDEIVKIIVDAGAIIDCEDWFRRTALGLAAENGHYSVVQSLLGQFQSEDSKHAELWSMALHCALKNGRKALVLALLAESKAKTKIRLDTLILAIQRRDPQIVQLLSESEPDLNTNAQDAWGWRPLMYATHESNEAIAIRRILIVNGALQDVHKLKYKYENSESPLSYVSEQGYNALANMLLEQEAFEKTSEENQKQLSPSLETTIVCDSRAKDLSQHKAIEANTKNKDGRTALPCASESEFVEIVKEREDIKMNTQDKEGQSENGKGQTVETSLEAENKDGLGVAMELQRQSRKFFN